MVRELRDEARRQKLLCAGVRTVLSSLTLEGEDLHHMKCEILLLSRKTQRSNK